MKHLILIALVALYPLKFAHAFEQIQISEPKWIAPSESVPPEFNLLASNNNLSIALHEGRLFVAWRNAPTHFASKKTKFFVASSADMGKTWVAEHEIALGTDMREPFLISVKGQLILQFFEAGSNPLEFKPRRMLRTIRKGMSDWTSLESFGTPGEVPWEVKVRNNQVYMTSYLGDHYSGGKSKIDVHFSVSPDGLNWKSVNPSIPFVYKGGVSEVGFEFTEDGTLWGVTRNEDGDDTGFGSHVVSSKNWGADPWEIPSVSNPNRYDSPRMFRHGKDLYLVARRDIGGPFWKASGKLPFDIQKWSNLVKYSLRPKRTALYKIDQQAREVKFLMDLPSAGDNAFPSIVQKDADTFLVANYSSPVYLKKYSWLRGQLSKKGTGIYIVEVHFSDQK